MTERIGPNPSGLCQCGCGELAPIARRTNRCYGHVKGHPVRFIRGHYPALQRVDGVGPNPGGLCLCGCGQATPLASESSARRGWVKGKPVRYMHGHGRHLRLAEYIQDENGCWIWQRTVNRDGYGRVDRDGEEMAHRWYYKQFVGPIPEGHHLHHTCETPACVNPAHLEPLTPAEHARRHAGSAVP